MALNKVFRTVASLFGMSAAMLTWVIGFLVGSHDSFISTTLALLIGLGGVLQVYDRHWRRSWILEAVGLVLGFYFNSIGPHFQLPALLIAASLLMVMFASLAAKAEAAKRAADEAEDMEREKR